MRQTTKSPGEKIFKDIKRAPRKHYSSKEKIRIALDGLRGQDSIAELCRLAGDTARAANADEVKELRRDGIAGVRL